MLPEPSRAPRALIADKDPDHREVLASRLTAQGWEVRSVMSGDAALAAVRGFQPEVVFLDPTIPQPSGYLVCAKLKLFGAGPAVVLMTSRAIHPCFAEVVGADQTLRKPLTAEKLQVAIARPTQAA
ncbi:MAG: response regulator [Planctomycetes bacterium]|nr:response regulator [Planctomycetota bacterium]